MTEQDRIKKRAEALLLLIRNAEALIHDAMVAHDGAHYGALMELSRAVLCVRIAFELQLTEHYALWKLPDGSIRRPNNAKLS